MRGTFALAQIMPKVEYNPWHLRHGICITFILLVHSYTITWALGYSIINYNTVQKYSYLKIEHVRLFLIIVKLLSCCTYYRLFTVRFVTVQNMSVRSKRLVNSYEVLIGRTFNINRV